MSDRTVGQFSDRAFAARFRQVGVERGWPTPITVSTALAEWLEFTTETERGYQWTIYEWSDEISVRDLLERALQDRELQTFPQTKHLASRVAEIDAAFLRATRDDIEVGPTALPWWQRRVPRRAGEELREDLRAQFGVEVELAEPPRLP